MLSTSSSTLSTTGKHSIGQHVHKQILALEKLVTAIVHRQLQQLSTPCTNPIRIGRMTMIRTPEIRTNTAYIQFMLLRCVKNSVTYPPKSENFRHEFSYPSYPTTHVTAAPIKEMQKVTQVCLYETLILLLSHDIQQLEFDSLFCTAGPNVQVPKHGVSTSAGQLKQDLAAFLKPRVAHRIQQAYK